MSISRHKHRESDVWQRRFWQHTIRDQADLSKHLDDLHYNPVKHELVSCPHLWRYFSFDRWVQLGKSEADWGCSCGGRKRLIIPDLTGIEVSLGE